MKPSGIAGFAAWTVCSMRVNRRAIVARLWTSHALRSAVHSLGLPAMSAARKLARVYFVPDSFSKTARQ
jgi:hypothetical protein